MMKRLTVASLALAIASCGKVSNLEPQAGQSLPQKPALASRPLDAEELLTLPTHAAPRRVDELNKRGDVRTADRFDLAPADSDAPLPPAGASDPAAPSTTGPDNQEPRR